MCNSKRERTRFLIREYAPSDETSLLRVWNTALAADPISQDVWRGKVLLDPNFDPEGCLVADIDGIVRGYALCLVRRVPMFSEGLESDRGWITSLAVEPRWQGIGIGTELLSRALAWFQSRSRSTVLIAPYRPNYFVPGVDTKAYKRGLSFLLRQGFETVQRPLSMEAQLPVATIEFDASQRRNELLDRGIEIRPASAEDILPVLQFARDHFSWSWYQMAVDVLHDLFLADRRQVGMWLAVENGALLGYAQHRAERFGPFGVCPDRRGQGIGTGLLSMATHGMFAKGYHTAWFLWTSDQAARLYERCGFREARRFAVLSKDIGG